MTSFELMALGELGGNGIEGACQSMNFSIIINGKPRVKIRGEAFIEEILLLLCIGHCRMLLLTKRKGLVEGFQVGKNPHKNLHHSPPIC